MVVNWEPLSLLQRLSYVAFGLKLAVRALGFGRYVIGQIAHFTSQLIAAMGKIFAAEMFERARQPCENIKAETKAIV